MSSSVRGSTGKTCLILDLARIWEESYAKESRKNSQGIESSSGSVFIDLPPTFNTSPAVSKSIGMDVVCHQCALCRESFLSLTLLTALGKHSGRSRGGTDRDGTGMASHYAITSMKEPGRLVAQPAQDCKRQAILRFLYAPAFQSSGLLPALHGLAGCRSSISSLQTVGLRKALKLQTGSCQTSEAALRSRTFSLTTSTKASGSSQVNISTLVRSDLLRGFTLHLVPSEYVAVEVALGRRALLSVHRGQDTRLVGRRLNG